MKLTEALAEAIKQGYVVVSNGTRKEDYLISNLFFHYCERTGKPFVRIRPKRKYARIEVDLIGQGYRMSEQCLEEMRTLLLNHHVGPASFWHASLSNELVYSNRIPIDDAATVAKGLIDILAKPGYREPVLYRVSAEVEAVNDALRDGTLSPACSAIPRSEDTGP